MSKMCRCPTGPEVWRAGGPGRDLFFRAGAGGGQVLPPGRRARVAVVGATGAVGETMLAIHMKPDRGWHGYWSNPGDAGQGMQLDWTLPEGAQAGEPQYPVPDTLIVSGPRNPV